MNKVLIECDELINKFELSKEGIIKQLESIKTIKEQDFIIAYDKDFRFTLIGEMCENNSLVVLTNIIKADDFREMDNTDLFRFLTKQGD